MASRSRRIEESRGMDPAGRQLNLAFVLATSQRPLATSEIIDDTDLGYGLDDEAARRGPAKNRSDYKRFERDRRALAEQGIIVRSVQADGASENEQARWTIDAAGTFVAGGIVTADDAELLLSSVNDYLKRGPSPLARPLAAARAAAAKALAATGRDVDEDALAEADPDALDPRADAVWAAFSLRRRLPFRYRNAEEAVADHVVAVYGIFKQKGYSYFVGEDEATGQVRTYRVDRIERAGAPTGSYRVPEGFDVRDYQFLPFDFSDGEPVAATFELAAGVGEGRLDALTHGRGRIGREDDGTWTWEVGVRDLDAAARFALAHSLDGMRPRRPEELVEAWRCAARRAVDANGR